MSFRTNGKIAGCVGIISCATILGGARPVAASIDYGNFFGNTVEYEQVTESSATSALPLYGPPVIAGNSLTFSPPDFAATSTNGGPPEITDGHLNTTIVGIGNSVIPDLEISEAGDYTLAGIGTDATSVSVAAPVILRITGINGVSVNPIQFATNVIFTPDGGTYTLPGDAGVGVIWTGFVSTSFDSIIASAGLTGHATQVIFDMDNTLTAFSQTGTIAFIQKKVSSDVVLTVVPEPTSIGLMAMGSLSLLARRRRA